MRIREVKVPRGREEYIEWLKSLGGGGAERPISTLDAPLPATTKPLLVPKLNFSQLYCNRFS
jgi:hypothetical protein